jgi:hypothetical protein
MWCKCGANRKQNARTALVKAIKSVGKAYKVGSGPLTAECIQQGMQEVLSNRRFLNNDELGNPAEWLPGKLRTEMQEAKVQTVKEALKNPEALSRAKDRAGISDHCARTLLLDLLPDRSWVPSGSKLQQARSDTNSVMKVRPSVRTPPMPHELMNKHVSTTTYKRTKIIKYYRSTIFQNPSAHGLRPLTKNNRKEGTRGAQTCFS